MSSHVNPVKAELPGNPTPLNTSVPTSLDGKPIIYSGNPAHAEGVLYQLKKCVERTGKFSVLLRHHAVMLTSGKMAIASLQSVPFITGDYDDKRNFDSPCPADIEERINDWDTAAVLTSGAVPTFTRLTTRPADFSSEYIINAALVSKEDTDFQVWLASIFAIPDDLEAFLDEANGSGIKMTNLLRAEVLKAVARDRALIRAEYNLVVKRGIPGAVTLENFNAFIKEHDASARNLPIAAKPSDETIMQMIQDVMLRDTTIGEMYDLISSTTPPKTLKETLDQARALLRGRQTKAAQDALERGGGERALKAQQQQQQQPSTEQQLAQLAGEMRKLKSDHAALLAGSDPDKDKNKDTRKRMADLMRSVKGGGADKVPRDDAGRVTKWVQGMDLCACEANVNGTTDAEIGGAKHLFRDCPNRGLAESNAAKIREKREKAGKKKQSGKLAMHGEDDVAPSVSIEGVDELSAGDFREQLGLLFANVTADDSDDENQKATVAISFGGPDLLLASSPFACIECDEEPSLPPPPAPLLSAAYASLADGVRLGSTPPPPSEFHSIGVALDSDWGSYPSDDDELPPLPWLSSTDSGSDGGSTASEACSLPDLVTASSSDSDEEPGFKEAAPLARRKSSPVAQDPSPPIELFNPFAALDALGDGGVISTREMDEMVPTESQLAILTEESAESARELSVAVTSEEEVEDIAAHLALSMAPPSPSPPARMIDPPPPSPPSPPRLSPDAPPPQLDAHVTPAAHFVPTAPVLAKLMVIGVEASAFVGLMAASIVTIFMLLASRVRGAAGSSLCAVRELPLKFFAMAILVAGLGALVTMPFVSATASSCLHPLAASPAPHLGMTWQDGAVGQHFAMPCAMWRRGGGGDAELEQLAMAAQSGGSIRGVLAALDSGCTANCTGDKSILTNLRSCDETYRDATGKKTPCTQMGDLPCVVTLGDGQMVRITFSNVRLVEGYTHTLLSVPQLWAEQRIDCRWRDLNHVVLPPESGGQVIPFAKGSKLSSITLACTAGMDDSAPQLSMLAEAAQSAFAALGFHRVGSHAHVGRLPAAKAAELCHRRWHVGTDCLRASPQVSSDAPSNLKSATAVACPHCAVTNITKASHGDTMPVPVAVPGRLHVDLKGPFPPSLGGYKYAVFGTDEHTRYVFVKFLKSREASKLIEAVEQIRAQFNAEVGVPVDENGKTLERPRVFSIRTDHEGALESKSFASFRSAETIHVDYSAPHDHDLNGIAERVNRTIDELATRIRHCCNAPSGFWPQIFRHAVNVHNSLPSAVGSSTADPLMSAHQRFTLKAPRVMDLCTFGTRAVALLPEPQRNKSQLEPRGVEGVFCGRSPDSPSCYEVWSDGRFISTSSVSVDEEHFPWCKGDEHRPLKPTAESGSQPAAPVNSVPTAASHTPASSAPFSRINHAPHRTLRALSLFSGTYSRPGGLKDLARERGWSDVDQIDSDSSAGGGWQDDLSNDRTFARVLSLAKAGRYDAIIIAFPCSTFSFARFFDANTGKPRDFSFDTSGDITPVLGDEGGPPPVRSSGFPNGLPDALLDPKHRGELEAANLLLERTVDIALAARASASNATIIIENPADRSVRGRPAFASDVGHHHGALFSTRAFLRLAADAGPMSQCTFAQCAFGGSYQKYTTLAYTNDAAPVLDKLNDPEFQCNHAAGAHDKLVGGRVEGTFSSGKSAAYPDELNKVLVDAITHARTGSRDAFERPTEVLPPPSPPVNKDSSSELVDVAEPATALAERPAGDAHSPAEHRRRAPPSSPAPFAGWARPANTPRTAPSPSAKPPVQGKAERAVRASTAAQRLEAVPEQPAPATHEASLAATMEAAVSDLVFGTAIPDPAPAEREPLLLPVSRWVQLDGHQTAFAFAKAGASLRRTSAGEWLVDSADDASLALFAQAEPSELPPLDPNLCLRADSDGAPSTHAEAMRMGGDWPKAEEKELTNHANNGSWRVIKTSEKPAHRRVHRLLWVYKIKRDGSCKARLCVQGCTLQHGVDFDQTFASTLRYSSARSLFRHAAENGCKVRSIDWVAAYLQGEFVDGEVVYCHMPPGYEQLDEDGKPMLCEVRKPIYGIPQAGRRLQRCVQPWLRNIGLRQLDDSDDCVWVYDSPDNETFAVGVYVDNLQIVHSEDIDENGDAVNESSFLAKFLRKIRADWDIVDEGPMLDLLGIQVEYQGDGSIKLHQTDYIAKLVQRFLPGGVDPGFKETSLPYSSDFMTNVADALSQECQHPELVKEFQSIIGCLMYSCTSVRPDIAFVVHRLCTCLTRPTPALVSEAKRVVSYLAMHSTIGITYDSVRTELSAYSDASWEDRRSTSGWVVLANLAALSWGSRGQKCISLSSCESEIVALSEAAKDVVYHRKFDKGLNNITESVPPTDLYCDNTGARDLSYNPVHHDKTKHIARRHFFVRDMVEAFELRVPFVRTEDNIADFFTKPMKSFRQFSTFRDKIMNVRASAESV